LNLLSHLFEFVSAKDKVDNLEHQVEELQGTIQDIKMKHAEEIRELEQKRQSECQQVRMLHF
jgi:hypothetical protein